MIRPIDLDWPWLPQFSTKLLTTDTVACSAVIGKQLRHYRFSGVGEKTLVNVLCFAESAKAHIRQSILSSEEAMKTVTGCHELQELRMLLQKVRDRFDGQLYCILLSVCF